MLSESVARQLRSLAREYAHGRLTLEAYRRLRGPLLDSLADAVSLSMGSPQAPEPRRSGESTGSSRPAELRELVDPSRSATAQSPGGAVMRSRDSPGDVTDRSGES